MKANKALKRLVRIEGLISDLTERYSASAPQVRDALQDARAAVTRAKEAVGLEASSAAVPGAGRKATRKNRRSEGQKARWAAKKAAEIVPAKGPAKDAPRKGGMTDEGRQRLAEAMKRRWAVKRAGSAVKKRVGLSKKQRSGTK
jgi:hypothetical protein